MQQKPCDYCNVMTDYEPIWLYGSDMMANLPHLCESCEKSNRESYAEKMKQEKIEKAKDRYKAAVPPKLRETDIKHPEYNLPAHKAVHHAYSMDESANILLFGPAGECKSRILARLCARAAFDGRGVYWITAHDFALLADRYKAYKTREYAHDEIMRLKHVSRLVFDDLGKQEWNPKIEEVFFAVIDHRCSHNMPTWFSANTHPTEMLRLGQFSKDRGASIVGRILDGTREFEFKPRFEK
jgi:DNA replication protein DnaC